VTPRIAVTDRELSLMNALNVVFPESKNLLCVWHINKNVLAKCKIEGWEAESFDLFLKEWNEVVWSKTEHLLDLNWTAFAEKWEVINHKRAVDYIQKTWIPHKERFISCFISQYFHFGIISTSRCEGNHSVIKNYLSSFKSDLLK
jgi:hypothetical protein